MSSIPKRLDPLAAPHAWAVPPAGVAALVVAAALLVPLVFLDTTLAMADIWARSETFAHGFLVVPLFAFLIWRERDRLAVVAARPFPPALAGVALAGALWWVADRLSAPGPAQFAMVAMVPFAVWAIFGTALVRAIAFPIAFLFFAVPVGEFLVPSMMDWTADFTVAALRLTGVPVYRELNYIMIPTGMWSVVEACSGLRYLIASVMVGVLFAWLTYRSAVRRLAFIVASVAVPIVANWLRAYLIVLLGHLTNNRLAAGVDHIIYGWIFFGVVMLLLFWVGARWREDAPAAAPSSTRAAAFQLTPAMLVTAAAVALLAFAWHAAEARPATPPAQPLALPAIAPGNGWQASAATLTAFRPEVSGYSGELAQTFEKDGRRVMLQVLLFGAQVEGHQALSTRNHLVWKGKAWKQVDAGVAQAPSGPVNTAVIVGEGERLAVWQWFWVDGHTTASAYGGQVRRVLGLLAGQPDTAAWVFLYTPTETSAQAARAALADFASAAAPAIDATLKAAAETRR